MTDRQSPFTDRATLPPLVDVPRKPDPRVERLVVEYRREVEGFGSGDAGGQAAAMPKSVLAMNKVDLVRGSRRGDLLDLARRACSFADRKGLLSLKAERP